MAGAGFMAIGLPPELRKEINMIIKPISLKEANSFIEKNHRHHKKVQGHKFSIGLYDKENLIGVAICGRPVARLLDDNMTLEITRLCIDGTYNACSILYSKCARIAREMGYKKIITYILSTENGASPKASNFILEDANCGGGGWDRPNRPRINKAPIIKKQRYAFIFDRKKNK